MTKIILRSILFLLTIGSLLLSGCVTTNIQSSINPDFQGKTFNNVLVIANLSDIGSQQIVENEVVEKLEAQKITAMQSYRVFFKGKDYTPEERRKRTRDLGCDSVLYIQFTDSYETQAYVPPSTTTKGTISKTYGGYNYSENTYQTGGTIFVNQIS